MEATELYGHSALNLLTQRGEGWWYLVTLARVRCKTKLWEGYSNNTHYGNDKKLWMGMTQKGWMTAVKKKEENSDGQKRTGKKMGRDGKTRSLRENRTRYYTPDSEGENKSQNDRARKVLGQGPSQCRKKKRTEETVKQRTWNHFPREKR